MSFKFIELDDLSPQGEPTVQIIRPQDSRLYHVKLANEALDYIKDVKPQDGKTLLLVLAMTAGDFYGFNRNGDGWPERPLRAGKTDITEEETLPHHYKTFETHGNVYRHHVNKDPEKRIGEIQKAFYNYKMHRVELLIALINRLAEDLVQTIESGKSIACSMGCRVRNDICSICGNQAPNRSMYCEHARNHLGDILPDGRKVGVWNPSPTFFDISAVRRPAEPVAWSMKKVAEPIIVSSAEMGEKVEDAQHKAAQLRKMSVIEKVIKGEIPLAKTDDSRLHGLKNFEDIARTAASNMPAIDDDTIKSMLKFKPAEVLSTLASMGIILTTPEFLKFFIWKLDPEAKINDQVLRKSVEIQRAVFDILANNPHLLDDIKSSGFLGTGEEEPSKEISEKFSHLLEKRSQLGSYLYRHIVPSALKTPTTKGKWDTLTMTDPQTGKQYETTRYAREKAEDWAVEHRLKDLAGGGLLLGGAYKLLTMPRLRFLSPLAAIPGAAMAWRGSVGYPSIRSQTGEEVSLPRTRLPYEPVWPPALRGGTEMVEKRSEINEGSALIVQMQDHYQTGAKNSKLAELVNTNTLDDVTFDQAAQMLGALICS